MVRNLVKQNEDEIKEQIKKEVVKEEPEEKDKQPEVKEVIVTEQQAILYRLNLLAELMQSVQKEMREGFKQCGVKFE